jgi:hypothetical protein
MSSNPLLSMSPEHMQSTKTLDRDVPRKVDDATAQEPNEYGPVLMYRAKRNVDANPNS